MVAKALCTAVIAALAAVRLDPGEHFNPPHSCPAADAVHGQLALPFSSAELPPAEAAASLRHVEKAKLAHHVSPIYSADLREEGVEGTVLLEAVINEQGEPTDLKQVNVIVDRRLVAAAMEAVRQWRYQPMLLNGQPTEVATTISVVFRLP